MQFQKIILFAIFLWVQSVSFAQILDDSTKVVYGPSTIYYSKEKGLYQDLDSAYSIDSVLYSLEKRELIEQHDMKYQYLGNLNTAHRPLFYSVPNITGVRSGMHSFDIFEKTTDDFRYFDTKSPYTEIIAGFGGKGRNTLNVAFSQNITPQWNAGFDFGRISSDKQVGATRSRGDKQGTLTKYDLFTSFNSKDSTYQMRAFFARGRNKVLESGGAEPPADGDLDELFDTDISNIWLTNAKSDDLRQHYHFYNQWKPTGIFKVYYGFDYEKQVDAYLDTDMNEQYYTPERFPYAVYGGPRYDSTVTNDSSHFNVVSNIVGIKGTYKGFFYRFSAQYRNTKMRYFADYEQYQGENIALPNPNFTNEVYIGGTLRQEIIPETWVAVSADFQLEQGNYDVVASLTNKWLSGSYRRIRYSPQAAEENYMGNWYQWNNNFESTETDQLKADINVHGEKWSIHPFVEWNLINNPVYYDTARLPVQSSAAANLITIGMMGDISFLKKWHLEFDTRYTLTGGDAGDVFRIPEIFGTASIFYQTKLFDDKIEIRTGLDNTFRSAYYGHDYDPVSRQFFLQNGFEMDAIWVADAFFDFQIDRWMFYAKLTYANQGFPGPGYFVAPYYIGQPRVFDFGMRWVFFD